MNDILGEFEKSLISVITFFKNEINKYKCGKADKSLFEDINVLYYDNMTPIKHMAMISVIDAKTVMIKAFEKKFNNDICKAIIEKNFGLNPIDDGDVIRIFFPPMSEERRKDLVKIVKNESEKAKIAMRNVRREFKDKAKDLKKESYSENDIKRIDENIQNMLDKYIKEVDVITENKNADIMKL